MTMPDNIKLAWRQLRHNRARSYLTMLGIIIGVASVISVMAIGEGVRQQLQKETGNLGKDVLTVQPAQPASLFQPAAASLTAQDASAMAKLSSVRLVTPLATLPGTVTTNEVKNGTATIIAAGSNVGDYFNKLVAYGKFYDSTDHNSSAAVVGEQVAARLFKESVPLGQSFSFRGHQFVIQGVLNQFPNTPLSPTASLNDAIIISYGTAKTITGSDLPIYQIMARTQNSSQAAAVAAVTKAVTASRGGQQDFTVSAAGTTTGNSQSSLSMLTRAIGGIAAIALIVGGIGVMNVMLAAVAERIHEIGIRKAVGATNRQILSQFMTEAAVICVAGGLLGVVLAYIVDGLLRLLTDLRPVISLSNVILSFVVTLAIGLLFGSAPAIKAARKDPIAALRSE